eukprot:c19238_g1_i1 orf=238-2940(+)
MADDSSDTERKYSRKAHKKKLKVVGFEENASDSLVSCKLAFCALAILCVMYATFFWVVRRSIYSMHVTPLPLNASLDKFSEGRTMKHIWYLADEIGIRQEGSIGLIQAAEYLKLELESYKQKASTNLRVEIDETFVYGSFNMIFLKHSIALAYKNHSNIAIRISAAVADEDAPAVLVNGHFDSAIGSPGAGDCASCVASMLEAVRLIIDTDWVPANPIIFLFNGAEELFMVACHGFMTTHKWRSTVGALINIEAAGTGGPDLVCQSGPGSWPAEVYAEAAVYPMANTAAQDIFPHMPGDTDYRMFSEDYGDVPGLDIILLLEGYFYHTPYDRPERMVAGSMQIRGENLMRLLRAFTKSPRLMNARDRADLKNKTIAGMEKRPVFFDFLGWFMISYPFKTAVALHTLPLGFVLFIASLTSYESSGVHHFSQRVTLILRGVLLHFIQTALAVLAPVLLAVLRLLPATSAMTWFAQPWLAIIIYVPISVAGMLLPKVTLMEKFIMKKNTIDTDNKKSMDWGIHWGAIALYSFGAAVGTHFVVGSGFSSFSWACFILPAYYLFQVFQKSFGRQSLLSFSLYILSLAFPILLSLYFGGMFWQTIAEKMGMNGSVPQPLGFYVCDIIMGAMTGYAVVLCLGPLMPAIGSWLASPHIVRFLIYISVCAAAVSSQFFPYSPSAPKRVLLQHTINTDGNQILSAHYDLGVFDANSVPFVFKHVPEVTEFLGLRPTFNSKMAPRSPSGTWMVLYPISQLFVESFRFPAESKDVLKNHPSLPRIILQHVEHRSNPSRQRTHVELELGSVHEVWAAVLNITGPLINWSFSDEQLPAPEIVDGGPPSYILRLSGRDTFENWKFWLEANESMTLRVDLAVIDQQLEEQTQNFLKLFPSWAAVIAGSTYLSSYIL